MTDVDAQNRNGVFELSLCSDVRVLPDTAVMVSARVMSTAVRPRRIIIDGDPSKWSVVDVTIGPRTQVDESREGAEIPGTEFARDVEVSAISFEVARIREDVAIVASYVGDDPDGEPLRCFVEVAPIALLLPDVSRDRGAP